ncbi:ABC transporter ATP-binding protein [Acetobacter sp. TBRC 12305]|uniref:ABC transporter ATP-binding protein n=1 Tax=Acetobacter garciniae TaxID=2817435 RepID=A0A939HN38_9PROT|nr:ABC transporter ATP-binding protein [Acetobacter garciniae]MBO1324442.1 ABC transporter ATP-binding protein [Acetobacter garciniae]MBX0344131.1 ABC transporter ATP-binding protein [Acetobacter garciniae]
MTASTRSQSALGQSVELENIRKSYGQTEVLKGISLHVAPGRFCTFLGASGSGKSTLLKILAGFEKPDSGLLKIGGRDMAGVPVRKRNIGMVFQNYALFPNMNVAQNIAFGLKTRKLDKAEIHRRVNEMLEMTGLQGLGTRLPTELSGGQQQRVALARALVIRPDLLLMDEPLGALDRAIRQSLQGQIKDIQRVFGITILFVTHDQEEALHLSDEIVVMKNGTIEQVGPPRTLYTRPASRFVGNFLGECNFLHLDGHDYAVRPEAIATGADTEGLDIHLEGEIRQITFLGPSQRFSVSVGDRNFTVTRPLRPNDEELAVGTRLRIGFRLADATRLASG